MVDENTINEISKLFTLILDAYNKTKLKSKFKRLLMRATIKKIEEEILTKLELDGKRYKLKLIFIEDNKTEESHHD